MNIGEMVLLNDGTRMVLGKYEGSNNGSIALSGTLHISKKIPVHHMNQHKASTVYEVNWNNKTIDINNKYKYSVSQSKSTYAIGDGKVYSSKNEIKSVLKTNGQFSLADKL